MRNRKFLDKFLVAFFVLVLFKIIAIIAQWSQQAIQDALAGVFKFIFFVCIVVVLIVLLQSKEKDPLPPVQKKYGGNGVPLDSSIFDRLKNMYEDIAEKHIQNNEYKKAAVVYMNLLKDYYRAAKTLENGEFYNEAAAVYLKKLNNKADAANCYVNAKQYDKAIILYKELQQKEKVGDLYKMIDDLENAFLFYQMVVDDYLMSYQMVKASLIYRNKMDMHQEAQKILLRGWEENHDPLNCLQNYFANIADVKVLGQEIQQIYSRTPSDKKIIYLEAMKKEFKKAPELRVPTRNIAYEIIAEKVTTRSEIVNELKHFNPDDEVILKDISRYKTGRNKMFRN
jgi:tetratricopeptide (TPR) repeat protein